MSHSSAWLLALSCVVACNAPAASPGTPRSVQQSHSASLVISPDASHLFVVHPDADSVSMIGLPSRTIEHEILLAAAPPSVSASGAYETAVGPRALALDSSGANVYVTGQRSGSLYAIDAIHGTLRGSVSICSEPVGVVVSADDSKVFVACAQDDEIVEVDATTLTLVGTPVVTPHKPWALAWGADGRTLFATHFLGPGVSMLTTEPLALVTTWTVTDGPAQPNPASPQGGEDPTEPHGRVRGLYDAAIRPGTSELWVAHLMLGIDTPQPTLDFQRTVFPALSILGADGSPLARLSIQANSGDNGAFGDVVSGPRSLTFSDDGKLAFVVDADSEDVLVVDAVGRVESQVVRPLPGHMPVGIVEAGGEIYVQEQNSEDIVAFTVQATDAGVTVLADGPPFASLAADPMPANLRLGQKLFYSANSDDVPVTQNHWVACASCHLEGRSDAVTWLFAQGPRDTPTNAGGLLDTGFLFRTADRNQVQDYWKTIDVEQGGDFNIDQPSQKPLLDAMEAFVDHAIPAPVPPSTDALHTLQGAVLVALRTQGETVFNQVGCATCHLGPAKTDSGMGNAALDLGGPLVSTMTTGGILLHDVGTCVTGGPWPDVVHADIEGDPRPACAFDTPALRGLSDSAPYLHDGSAATLADVIPIMLAASTPGGPLSPADETALVEFLRSL